MKNYYIEELISVEELCKIIKIKEIEFIKKTFLKGIIIQKNEILKFEIIKKLCKSLFEINILKNDKKTHKIEFLNNYFNISIIGNVNSGKTTLIDFIFKKNISFNEIGNITQLVSVFETFFYKKKIFFFDLPGHEIFNKVIKTFINISNVLFLIISVENEIDKVYENIINLTKQNNIDIVICINKIDIINKNFFLKGYNIFKISSKNGYGIKNLLINSINIFNSKNNIKFLEKNYNGIIVNSFILNNVFSTTLFLFKGIFNNNNYLYFKNEKIFVDNIYINNILKNSVISPCIFIVKNIYFPINFFFSLEINNNVNYNIEDTYKENYHNYDNYYIKSNNHTIAISINDFFNNLKNNNKVNLLKISLGDYTSNDLKYCQNFKCKILIVGIKLNFNIKKEIINNNLFLKEFELVNDVISFFKKKYNFDKIEEITGELIIKEIFPCGKNKKIAGCTVINGYLDINNQIKIYKELKLIFQGKINTLKIKNKNSIKVFKNEDCGINIKNFNDIEINMKIISIKYV